MSRLDQVNRQVPCFNENSNQEFDACKNNTVLQELIKFPLFLGIEMRSAIKKKNVNVNLANSSKIENCF